MLIPEDRRVFDWHDGQHDPEGKYAVDCRINGMPRPIFVHALLNDAQTRDATITLHQFEKWDVPFSSLAVFSDQESITRKVLARFSDVCDKQFSSLNSNQDRIERFIKTPSQRTTDMERPKLPPLSGPIGYMHEPTHEFALPESIMARDVR